MGYLICHCETICLPIFENKADETSKDSYSLTKSSKHARRYI
ncbi:hypothetical protein EWB00_010682 [Schistosoma japonicum]|uniref:Uncharacterized protein n=1 Tax=Schistosoma japonicum TaxID=6182 RepID=A0A4Z2DNA8_SCHJA|nr:hypothetical protein EWB00_010682 [Schistosoma japonicum]